MKNDTCSHTRINKSVLLNLPNIPLIKLFELFSISLYMRLFPGCFQHGQLKLIVMSNKPFTDPLNYRPFFIPRGAW